MRKMTKSSECGSVQWVLHDGTPSLGTSHVAVASPSARHHASAAAGSLASQRQKWFVDPATRLG
jgi:hypothetical protein